MSSGFGKCEKKPTLNEEGFPPSMSKKINLSTLHLLFLDPGDQTRWIVEAEAGFGDGSHGSMDY
jgi:hypothetical protein